MMVKERLARHGQLCALLLVYRLRACGNRPDGSEQLAANRDHGLIFILPFTGQLGVPGV